MSPGELPPDWLTLLRCPFCGGSFHFDEAPRPQYSAAEFGVLSCGQHRFPVIDGIPIIQRTPVGMFEHTTGRVEVPGVPVAELVSMVSAGRGLEALLECLVVPEPLPSFAQFLPWRVRTGPQAKAWARARGQHELRTRVLERRHAIGAKELFAFFYRPGRALQPDVGQYFMLRFGQPRHLAALALLAELPDSSKPVLDLACGAGHLVHYLTHRAQPVPVLGTDMNFFQVWIARHWLAPAGRYVCGNARDGLPFAADSFSAVLCSDAWHYLQDRPAVLREIQRCAPNRPVILTRVGNRAVAPNEGVEATLAGYREEIREVHPDVDSLRAFDETDLLRCYLRRRHALRQSPRSDEELGDAKWLSFVWNAPDPGTEYPWDDADWPHAVGEIGLNPIYATSTTSRGELRLRFEFPGVWYAYENHAMLVYHPQQAQLSRNQAMNLPQWRDDAHLRALVDSFVLLGLPARFHAGNPRA